MAMGAPETRQVKPRCFGGISRCAAATFRRMAPLMLAGMCAGASRCVQAAALAFAKNTGVGCPLLDAALRFLANATAGSDATGSLLPPLGLLSAGGDGDYRWYR